MIIFLKNQYNNSNKQSQISNPCKKIYPQIDGCISIFCKKKIDLPLSIINLGNCVKLHQNLNLKYNPQDQIETQTKVFYNKCETLLSQHEMTSKKIYLVMENDNARTIDKYHIKTKILFYQVKTDYSGQRLLSHILLFETTCF